MHVYAIAPLKCTKLSHIPSTSKAFKFFKGFTSGVHAYIHLKIMQSFPQALHFCVYN